MSTTGLYTARAEQSVTLAGMLAELDRAKPGSDKAEGSLEQLRKALDLGPEAMAALLLLAERRNGDGADRASELARSTQTYHEILDALAAMEREEPTELVLLERAQTAMTEGRFDDAEAEDRRGWHLPVDACLAVPRLCVLLSEVDGRWIVLQTL